MEETYFWKRVRASLAMAQNAGGSAARLIHLELAGRYSIAATEAAAGHPGGCPEAAEPRISSFHREDNDRQAQSSLATAT